jgi:hypothetical protein
VTTDSSATLSLQLKCAAIMASGFDIDNRIKSIAQVSQEELGAASIVVYQYNRTTHQLEVIAMPGAPHRELMRGPTDKLIFEWEKTGTLHGRDGVWLEDDGDFDSYLEELARQVPWREDKPKTGDYRRRERNAHEKAWNGRSGHTATAKVYLWKGIGQTNDRVGQVFFNFFVEDDKNRAPKFFTDELKSVMRYVCDLIRELLVEKSYHRGNLSSRLKPEDFLHELDAKFDQHARLDPSSIYVLEREVADTIRAAAQNITGNFIGHAEFIYLIGQRLLRVFDDHPESDCGSIRLVGNDPLASRCIGEAKYYVRNITGSSLDKHSGALPQDGFTDVPQLGTSLDPQPDQSMIIAPVVVNGEVRALVRLTTPVLDRFLDEQARAMQVVEQFARYSISRLDERLQRKQMSASLDFYTSRLRLPEADEPAGLLKGLLAAFGAEWGTFWPIQEIDRNGFPTITRGLWFDASGEGETTPDDPDKGIRTAGTPGLTQALCKLNCAHGNVHEALPDARTVFFACHLLQAPDPRQTGRGYYLEVFSEEKPPDGVPERGKVSDGFWRYAVTYGECLPGMPNIGPNPDSTPDLHTRLAFLVREGTAPRAVVWLKFPGLHEVAWWERRYIAGLGSSLGELLSVISLRLALRSFRHQLRNFAFMARVKIGEIQNRCDQLSKEEERACHYLRSYVKMMESKAAETELLVAAPAGPDPEITFERDQVGYFVDAALCMVTRGEQQTEELWLKKYSVDKKTSISGIYFPVLLNLADNASRYGWVEDKQAPGLCRAAIWVHKQNNRLVTCVANVGPEANESELQEAIPGGESRTGLRISRTLLSTVGGSLRYFTKQEFLVAYRNAPQEIRHCKVFFEFTVPLAIGR